MNLKNENEAFNEWFDTKYPNVAKCVSKKDHDAVLFKRNQFDAWIASGNREGYVLVPLEPSEDQWSGIARHLGRYMQMHDRYCPKSLKKYFDLFIGDIPDWLNKEVKDWESEHAFATADLPVFIYKAMLAECQK